MRSPRWSGSLVIGLLILLTVLLVSVIGSFVVDPADGIVGAVTPSQRPSAQHLLGTDSQGRDMLTIMVKATPQTLRIGLIAGIVGIAIGLVLGLVSGYFGGAVDTVIRLISDSLMTVPGIAVLLVIAVNVGHMTVELMGLTVAVLSWMYPTRLIRSQVLDPRAPVHRRRPCQRGQRAAGRVPRDHAEPAAVHRRELHRRRQRRDAGLDRPGGARAGRQRRPHARDDDLLGAEVQRRATRTVVVVSARRSR